MALSNLINGLQVAIVVLQYWKFQQESEWYRLDDVPDDASRQRVFVFFPILSRLSSF